MWNKNENVNGARHRVDENKLTFTSGKTTDQLIISAFARDRP